jgi:MFS family permease
MTVFTLSWGTSALGYGRQKFLIMQLFGIVCFALTIPLAARMAERARKATMIWITVAIAVFGLVMAPMFVAGTFGAVATMAIGLGLMGMTYGPLGTVLSEMFPTSVRYTGSSLTFNLAGIFGASLAPYIWPRPLIVACHRSSIIDAVFDTGVGQVGAVVKGLGAVGHSVPFMPSVSA